MTVPDWLTILAILLAPLVAIQVQRRLDVARERRLAKLRIFQTLMATRAARVSPDHVQALNMIDIEFYGKRAFPHPLRSAKEKAVVDQWKLYLDHLNSPPAQDDPVSWFTRGDDLFTELLFAMSKDLDYDFDKVHLKRGIYAPQAHGQLEFDQTVIRKGLAQLLSGTTPLLVRLSSETSNPEAAQNKAGKASGGPEP